MFIGLQSLPASGGNSDPKHASKGNFPLDFDPEFKIVVIPTPSPAFTISGELVQMFFSCESKRNREAAFCEEESSLHKAIRHGLPALLLSFVLISLQSFVFQAHAASGKIIIAYSSINPNSSLLDIARARGFYRKYSLDPEIILVRSSATTTAGLASGNIQVGYTGGSALLNAAAEGLPLKMLASFDNRLTYDFIAKPEIKSPGDLRGKRVGVGSLGGTPWMAVKLAFEHLGLDEKRDRIQVVAMSNQITRFQALGQGSIDASILQGNYSRVLKAKGFTLLVDLERANIPFVGAGVLVASRFLRENHDVVENFLKALLENQSFIVARQNKSAVMKLMGNYLREKDPDALEDAYHVLYANMTRKPIPSIPGLLNIKRLLAVSNPKVSDIRVEDLVDDSFMRRFESSGLLDRAATGSL
jgi:ABC-type nitrate/sulfonate/bicarbonate transport system substrate-binding protein